jgi:hypothetical protein
MENISDKLSSALTPESVDVAIAQTIEQVTTQVTTTEATVVDM